MSEQHVVDNPVIEPGLLPLFRTLIGAELLFLVLRLGTSTAFQDGSTASGSSWFGLIFVALLLLFLFSSKLQKQLGRLYLPLAITALVALTLFGASYGMRLRLEAGVPAEELARSTWFLLVFFIVPVVIVAWQYHFRGVLWFCLIISLVQLVLLLPLSARGGPDAANLIAITLGHCLIYLPVGYAVARLMEAQRSQRRALAEANEKLTRYANTLEQIAVDRERNRLAQELHDTLAHGLSSIAVQLEAMSALWQAQPQNLRSMLTEALSTTRNALGESRRAIGALRASPLEDHGLVKAVQLLAQTAAKHNGFELDLQVSNTLSNLDDDSEHAIYRIAAEAIANVVRHANAKKLIVKLEQIDDNISLCITDDGRGFDSRQNFENEHFGLWAMQERARQLGSDLTISSTPGLGTTVQFTLCTKTKV